MVCELGRRCLRLRNPFYRTTSFSAHILGWLHAQQHFPVRVALLTCLSWIFPFPVLIVEYVSRLDFRLSLHNAPKDGTLEGATGDLEE